MRTQTSSLAATSCPEKKKKTTYASISALIALYHPSNVVSSHLNSLLGLDVCVCFISVGIRQKISIITAQVFLDVKSVVFTLTFTNIRARQHLHPCQQGNWVGGFETDSPVRAGLYSKQLLGSRPWRTQCFLTDALRVKFRRNDKSTQRT